MLGEADELFALKRIHLARGATATELQFCAPDEPGDYTYELFLVSDTYIGLDQRHEVSVRVAAA